jgi:hypothetical protein
MNQRKENYSWKLSSIINTFKLYFKCSLYKTLLFSIILYPLPIILNLSKEKIKKRKNKILSQELKKYIKKTYRLDIKEIEGSFALGGIIEVFSKRLYDFFEISEKDIIYDVGATIGEYSLKCAKKGAKVLAFELEKDSYDSMIKNIQANNFENQITPFNCRVDDKKNSLDTFFNKTKEIPTLIKMDIEGDEEIALKGAEKILKRYKPRIILETHSEELEKNCMNFLKFKRYKIVDRKYIGGKNKEVNLLFLK